MLKSAMDGISVSLTPWQEVPADDLRQWQAWVLEHPAWQSAFLSPTFAGAVHAAMGGVFLLRVFDTAGLRALMPMRRMAGGWGRCGVWEPAGGVMSDRVAFLYRPGSLPLPLAPMLAQARIGTLFYTHVEEADAGPFAPNGRDTPRVGLRIRLDDAPHGLQAYEEALAQRDPKLVADTARRERKLRKDHGELRFAYRAPNPGHELQCLLQMKRAQYARTGVSSPLSLPGHEAILRHLLSQDAPECGARLSTLHCGHRLVAAHLGLRCGATLHYWFPVYGTDFRAYSPGRLLLRMVMRAAFEEGVNCIDRGEGDTDAKRDFANESRRFVRGAIQGPGPRGRWAALALSVRWRIDAARSGHGRKNERSNAGIESP